MPQPNGGLVASDRGGCGLPSALDYLEENSPSPQCSQKASAYMGKNAPPIAIPEQWI